MSLASGGEFISDESKISADLNRRTKLAHANEGEERARKDAEVEARKRKHEDAAKWEREYHHQSLPNVTLRGKFLPAQQVVHLLGAAGASVYHHPFQTL